MVWTMCRGFSNYEVSNEGGVRNRKSGAIQRHVFSRRGLHQVILRNDLGYQQRVYIHDLMADVYFGGDREYREVLYKDGNYDNLRASNLVFRLQGARRTAVRETGRTFKNRKECCAIMSISPSKLSYCISTGKAYKGFHYYEFELPPEDFNPTNWDELRDDDEYYDDGWANYYVDEDEDFDEED